MRARPHASTRTRRALTHAHAAHASHVSHTQIKVSRSQRFVAFTLDASGGGERWSAYVRDVTAGLSHVVVHLLFCLRFIESAIKLVSIAACIVPSVHNTTSHARRRRGGVHALVLRHGA